MKHGGDREDDCRDDRKDDRSVDRNDGRAGAALDAEAATMRPDAPERPSRRSRIGLRRELLLVLAPTVTVLLVLVMVEAISRQRLLFASLASSAFLVYLDPSHAANQARTLVLAQMGAATVGMLSYLAFGPGYLSAGVAMLAAIVGMVVFDVLHPPSVSTALSFGLRAGDASNLLLFGLALAITVALIGLQKLSMWLIARWTR